MNGSSERTNQIIEISLQFFVHAIKDLFCWPKVLPQIQFLLNNTSFSTIRKTTNEINYDFSPRRLFDLILAIIVLNTCVASINAANAISFALFNQKKHYNRKHQLLFIKVGVWAMLKLYKGYLIPLLTEIIKKLIQQYVDPF